MSAPTGEQRDAKIRELLLLGNDINTIVAHAGTVRPTREDVLRVAAQNGWKLDPSGRVPRPDRARAGEQLRAAAEQRQAQAAPPPQLTVVPRTAEFESQVADTKAAAAVTPPLWTALAKAREHEVPAIKRRADRIHELLEQLAADVAHAEQERERRERVAELERQLAEAKAALKGSTTKPATASTSSRNGDAAKVRAWARDNGVDVPAYGRVPNAVVEQWRKATSS